jgi:hypothetical protein
MREPFDRLLTASFHLLAIEAQPAYTAVVRQLGSLVVGIDVEGEEVVILTRGDELVVEVAEARARPDVRIRATREDILAVIDGRLSLHDAVDSGAVEIIGDLEAIARAHDALIAYTHGAVRSPTFPTLLERLRHREVGG